MFDILIGSKFSKKCKHSLKCIKCRLETIRKKKHAIERCLRKDVADLVSIGHDANAFGRMDALLFEINQISCYDMIERYCCCILEHLPTIQKERECPKETMEAVATLIFAAARFSDLPELANLRHGFVERYRTTMELYTNREFVEKLQKKSFLQNEKLRLMKDIAKEFNIDWDVKSLEYKLSNPLANTIVKNPLENGYLKPTSHEMYSRSDNGDYRKNTAFSVRRKHLEQGTPHARSTGEADSVTKTNTINMDLNHQQGIHWQCKQTNDDVIDGEVNQSHRNHRTYNEKTIHERRSTNTTNDGGCDNEEKKGDKPSQHYSKKGESGKARTGTSEPKKQSVFDSSRVPEKIMKDERYFKLSEHTPARTASLPPTETHVGRHVRSGSMQPVQLSPNGDRTHPRLPDYDDLSARIAALRNS